MRRVTLVFFVALTLTACPGIVSEPTTGGGAGGGGAAAGGGAGAGDGGAAETSGCGVEQLLAARCTQCHGAVPMNGAPVSLDTLTALRLPSQQDATKSNAERCLIRMKEPVARMPPVPESPATADEIALMETWLAAGLPACPSPQPDGGTGGGGGTTMDPDPNLLPQNELFMCTPGTESDAPTRIRRLNRWEWTRNVGGSVTRSWTGFSFYDNPFDPSAGEPYSTWSRDETLDESMVEIFLPIVSEAGPPWAGPYTGSNRLERLRNDTTLRCMYQQNRPNSACMRHYLSEFLEHGVYFRPARTDELDRLEAFASAVILSEQSPDGGLDEDTRTHSITRISNAAWLTVGAMFREETGDPAAPDAGRVALTDWQLAQQLAYAVGARAPGATPLWVYPDFSAPEEGHMADIADAARDGGIRNDQVVDQLYRKYAGGTDATRFDLVMDWRQERRIARGEQWLGDGVMNFFREWLGYSHVASVFKERPEATSAYDDGDTSPYRHQLSSYGNLMDGYYGYESILTQQMDDVIARVVMNDQDVLKNLLTTRQYFLPANVNGGSSASAIQWTGEIYGTEDVINQTNMERWRMMPMLERAGVLTHPAWLGAHGGNFEDDPSIVHRGKWVRENLLCGWVPPLSSVRVQAMVGPHAANKNARARLDEATASQQCQGCHSLMNPLGYPFELYNHAGYLRVRDHAVDGGWMPPDGTVTLSGLPDPNLNGPVRDAVEFSEKLADSPWVKRCFVRQTFRYFMGRAENRTDACTLSRMEQAYDSNNGSFHSMVSALLTSDTWKTRSQ